MSESLVPRPDIRDDLGVIDGEAVELTLDNCQIVLHRNGYDRMNHLRVLIGQKLLLIFKIDANPLGEYLLERGYDVLIKSYPDNATASNHLDMELEEGMREWDDGTGHELDD